ncbi:MAG: alkaline phosphatase family protein [Thermomicrobiales bacterium]|nr:alkaline phosphatase family protein [Thermomicrobiales bacterium]
MLRLIRWAVTVAIVQGTMLLLLATLLDGFSIATGPRVLVLALIFTAAQLITWPFVYRLSVRVHPLLFPILAIGLSGLMLFLVAQALIALGAPTLRFDDVETGIWVTLGLSLSFTLFAGVFAIGDGSAYDWFVLNRLRTTFPNKTGETTPGTLFIGIDGLAAPLLQNAIDEGWMPNLARWQAEGTHVLNRWETDLSSQTCACQAGILLGNNHNIPAFRWYDKQRRTLVVGNSLNDVRALERTLSSGNGLLQQGASRLNMFSGDAPDSLLTYSTMGKRAHGSSLNYVTLWASPFMVMRTLALFVGDVFRERWQARAQSRNDVQPRIHRSFKYAFERAITTTIMLEMAQFMLLADMYRGIPAVYCTMFAYDEVAHHSGIDRTDAFKVLSWIDDVIGVLERERQHAARPYELVILSDHGQSQGATFRQRNGQSLGELVKTLIGDGSSIAVHDALEEHEHIRVTLQQAIDTTDSPYSLKLYQKALDYIPDQDEDATEPGGDREPSDEDVLVLASGNLGLISFPKFPNRVTIEEISQHFPLLVSGLVNNADIGFIMMATQDDGTVVLGRHGMHYLKNDAVLREDPLAGYGVRAADHLRRTDTFDNVPDILVMSTYDAERDEVYAFEELVGSHGGLGGMQTEPFVFHPIEYRFPEEPVVGAAALHGLLLSWLTPPASVSGVDDERSSSTF